MSKLKEGDEEAARQLWEHYFDRVVAAARNRLNAAPRRVSDEEDVAVSVFDSLCRGAQRGHFPDLSSRDDLWALLLRITQHKTVDLIRHNTRQKRGGGQVRGESVFGGKNDSELAPGMENVAGAQIPPEFQLVLDETHEQLLGSLRDDTLRQVAQRRMAGFSNDEIAKELGIGLRAVERKLQLIRMKWAQELES